jgi:hypothetical protein
MAFSTNNVREFERLLLSLKFEASVYHLQFSSLPIDSVLNVLCLLCWLSARPVLCFACLTVVYLERTRLG